jgi:prepilin-type N-terminal cleavage/methylation domain-containing protein
MKRAQGFTLIELLVVISIISLLSSVALAALNSARDKAKYARSRQEMISFVQAAVIAQGESNKTILQISQGSGSTVPNCSACACSGNVIGNTGVCYTNWIAVRNAIQANSNGLVSGLTNIDRDPWGSPYMIDENEGEGGASDCRPDQISTVGKDGVSGGGDDVTVYIPLKKNPCP